MIDEHLIESFMGDAELRLHPPTPRNVVLRADAEWEGGGSNYFTVFRDDDRYRMYYRGARYKIAGKKFSQTHPQVTCYAESRDGIHWTKPKLNLIEFQGSKANNIVWATGKATHNFAPFKDNRPGVPADQRYKAIASTPNGQGISAFASADGLRWRLLSEQPLITKGAFDSQNLAFWDSHRKVYRAYYRDFRDGYRDIRTATSADFLSWKGEDWLEYPHAPRQHLYTSQIAPYDRAPHILIGFPTRYADRGSSPVLGELPDAKPRAARTRVNRRYGTALTDTLLMTSRDGQSFHQWNEVFLRPGPERPGTWLYGHLYTAWGIVETPPAIEGAPKELSLYATEGLWTGKGTQLRRYTLRTDGFASAHAGISGGEVRTKSLKFKGKELELNLATSAIGYVRIAIHDEHNKPVPGFGLNDCVPLFGDSVSRTVKWNSKADLSSIAGRPVRLRIVLKDADLYSFRFR